MVGMGLYRLMRLLRGSVCSSTILSTGCLFFYVWMVGETVSAKRAFLMFVLLVLARCVGRTYDRLTAFAVTVAVLLLENPFLLDYSGFCYSCLAIMGVILAGEHASGWKISLFIQLLTIPMTAYNSYEIPVFGIVANLLVLPLSGVVVGSAMIGGIVGLFSGGFSKILLLPAEVVLRIYGKVCELIGSIPGNLLLIGCPSMIQIISYYVLFALVWYALSWYEARKTKEYKTTVEKQHGATGTKQRKTTGRMWHVRAGLLAGYSGMMLAGILLLSVKHTEGLTISVLDVGQGDGICMQLADHTTVFVDGGSTDVSKAGIYRIEPFLRYHRIGEVDWWFVSHFDQDHVSGLIELLEEGYRVHHIVVAEHAVENESYRRVCELAERQDTVLLRMKPQDVLRTGRGKAQTTLTCLAPDREYSGADTNAQSLVLLIRQKEFSGILTGDIGKEQEQALTHAWTEGRRLTWYKAAHHGSAGSNDALWLRKLQPLIATISYGKGNRYGHPAMEAIENISQTGCRIYQTARLGQIRLHYDGRKLTIRKYRTPLDVLTIPMLK